MNKVIIGLGSNISPDIYIPKAKEELTKRFKLLAESKFVQTKPIGYLNQADFINGSVYIETAFSYEILKKSLKEIEIQLNRTPPFPNKYGPRTIDLDIIIWNEQVVNNDFYEREYLKISVLELIPQLSY